MSILDELKEKAEAKRRAQERPDSSEGLSEHHLKHIYKRKLLPKMQFLFNGFKELIEHLEFLEEPVQVSNYSANYPGFGVLTQKNYKINTDGRMGMADFNRLMQINVNFTCEGDGKFNFTLPSHPSTDKEHAFLFDRGLRFHQKPHGHHSTLFVVERKIPVRFSLKVDYHAARLKVAIYNHENFQTFKKSVMPEQLDDEFMDALFCYFMRRDDRFVRTDDISEIDKSVILSHLAPFNDPKPPINPPFADAAIKNGNKIVDPIKNLFTKFQR